MDQKCSFTVTVSLKHSHFKNYSFCAFINLGRPQTKGVCWTGLPRPEEDSHIHKEQGNFQRDTMPTRQAATMVTGTHNTENIPHNSHFSHLFISCPMYEIKHLESQINWQSASEGQRLAPTIP